ncbi:carbamoyl-phosphate synthase large subunit [Phycisphaerales bacterium AB-hyl4]|uniref:Carbamoyl phosphate synthase large chain n=1 Tax=Natronomicrosphaera hydrolytica TaxID=3242702 RepID=A0ABV4U298_9BACT
MPKRHDIKTILIIGSGPIVIGQGCEFDYSGTQACKALREEGYQVVLVNSNPATIMTDPEFSDRTYIEPITPEAVTKIIEKEQNGQYHIDALLPTLGGQTALNCACQMYDDGTLEKFGIEMIGATREVIYRAEDRKAFKDIVEGIGLAMPAAGTANTMAEANDVLERTGLPAIIRPAFTLGGTGGGIAYNREEFEDIVRRGLDASMTKQVLIDRSLIGWKEYELEVMRDHDDNVVIICSIENIDAMGVHTGDSITVAPAQTLTDKEYQRMRDASQAIIRAVGVETGGCNIQFAINPADGEMVVVEMNPRVSRSSALASKATGFAIAKIAAKLAVGYTLWELPNDITGKTVACFEPTIDYVVTKIPRWTFEKFPEADETLTTQMKSVGEAMSIGRTFKESLQKGIRSMEVKRFGLGLDANDKWLNAKRDKKNADGSRVEWPIDHGKLRRKLIQPSQGRMYYVRYAFKMGWSIEHVHDHTHIDPWFLDQIKQLVDFEDVLTRYEKLEDVPQDVLFKAKQYGYSDMQLANLYFGAITTNNILKVRARRLELDVKPVYKLVDTCAAEFEAATPYYYSTYERPIRTMNGGGESGQAKSGGAKPSHGHGWALSADDEIRVTDKKKVIILGGGPNRIGQGIEFDYCCVQAAFAANELGYESVMVNSNPETVSTDYDTSDLLFFEPLTLEDVLNICERLNGAPLGEPGNLHGVIVQFGGQTPLNLAHGLEQAGVPIIGTSVDSIDLAEDRERFGKLIGKLGIEQPEHGIAFNADEAVKVAEQIAYPVLVRPSFVLGGRAMETVFDEDQLRHYMQIALGASDLENQPILVDDFLADAIECDVDVVADYGRAGSADGNTALVCGVMEHIEEAGIHSGDSACAIPPHSLPPAMVEQLKEQSRKLAAALKVHGLMNVQWAIRKTNGKHEVFVLEVNPRASRTVPFVSKATGMPWARLAAKVMIEKQLTELGVTEEVTPKHTSVKESVFPFAKFPGVDVILGPEMRSTGECMGADPTFPIAFAKSQMSAGVKLPQEGKVFLSVRESDKPAVLPIAKKLVAMGFDVLTTGGTHRLLNEHGIVTTRLQKISEGRPNAVDLIKNGELALIINTPTRKGLKTDEGKLRATAVRFNVPMITTVTGAAAAVQAIDALRSGQWQVRALQDYFPTLTEDAPKPAAVPG